MLDDDDRDDVLFSGAEYDEDEDATSEAVATAAAMAVDASAWAAGFLSVGTKELEAALNWARLRELKQAADARLGKQAGGTTKARYAAASRQVDVSFAPLVNLVVVSEDYPADGDDASGQHSVGHGTSDDFSSDFDFDMRRGTGAMRMRLDLKEQLKWAPGKDVFLDPDEAGKAAGVSSSTSPPRGTQRGISKRDSDSDSKEVMRQIAVVVLTVYEALEDMSWGNGNAAVGVTADVSNMLHIQVDGHVHAPKRSDQGMGMGMGMGGDPASSTKAVVLSYFRALAVAEHIMEGGVPDQLLHLYGYGASRTAPALSTTRHERGLGRAHAHGQGQAQDSESQAARNKRIELSFFFADSPPAASSPGFDSGPESEAQWQETGVSDTGATKAKTALSETIRVRNLNRAHVRARTRTY
jgi:hypothetical protein